MEDAPPPGGAPPAGDGADAAEPAGQPPAEEAKEAKAPEVVQKKKKLKKHDLVVNHTATFQLPASTIDTFKNEEYEMMVQDRQIRELQERKNDLESYIYSMRDRVSGGNLSDYIAQADKDTFLKLLEEMENWLYEEEAETANKSLFISKLDELKKFGEPPAERYREEEQRPDAYRELEKVLTEYSNLAATQDPAYEHIDAEARAKVTECVNEATTWMNNMKSAQEAKSKTEPMACTCKDIYQKKDNVYYTCRPIMNKPKPKPPPKEEPKKDAAPAEPAPGSAGDQAPAEGPAPGDGPAPPADAPMKDETGDAPAAGDAMDVGLD